MFGAIQGADLSHQHQPHAHVHTLITFKLKYRNRWSLSGQWDPFVSEV